MYDVLKNSELPPSEDERLSPLLKEITEKRRIAAEARNKAMPQGLNWNDFSWGDFTWDDSKMEEARPVPPTLGLLRELDSKLSVALIERVKATLLNPPPPQPYVFIVHPDDLRAAGLDADDLPDNYKVVSKLTPFNEGPHGTYGYSKVLPSMKITADKEQIYDGVRWIESPKDCLDISAAPSKADRDWAALKDIVNKG